MYIPKDFAQTEFDEIKRFIAQSPLATIIVPKGDWVETCPVSLLWQRDTKQKSLKQADFKENSDNGLGCLIGHVAKLNPITQLAPTNWQVVFTSQGHYISPNWYPSKALTHREVPTWNYQTVVFSVTAQMITDPLAIKHIVATITDFFEQQLVATNPAHQPWSLTDAPTEYIDAMCRGIVGIKLSINRFEAKFKLSQNKTAENRLGVIAGLTQLQSTTADNMATLLQDTIKE